MHDLLVVLGNTTAGVGGMMIFDRTAQGNAKPLQVINGGANGKLFVYPPRNEIIVIGNSRMSSGVLTAGGNAGMAGASGGFVSVWNIDDEGDAAPRRWRLELPDGVQDADYEYGSIMGAGIDTKNKAILIANKSYNAIFIYTFSEIF